MSESDGTANAAFVALSKNASEALYALLASGVSPDVKSPTGMPLLLKAVQTGNLDLVKVIVDRGANKNALSPNGHNAVYFAKRYGHGDIERFLTRTYGLIEI